MPLPSFAFDPNFRRYIAQKYSAPVPTPPPMPAPLAQGGAMGAVDDALKSFDQRGAAPAVQQPPRQAVDDELTPLQMPKPAQASPPQSTPQTAPGWLETIGGALSSNYDPREYDRRVEQMRQQRLADPSSQESQAMRARMAPMLQQLGLKPSEIMQLSGADITRIGGAGGLTQGLLEARQKAALAAQKKADAAALFTQQQQSKMDAEKRAAAEWDRQNAVTAPQALERARAVGGMATGRMVQGALLQDQLQSARAAEADQRKKEAEAREEARRQREHAVKTAADTEKKLIDEELSLDKLEKKLSALPPDAALPGQGNIASRALIRGKKELLGGSGMDPEETSLDTDLTATGLQAYMNTAGNAPNSEREQIVANQLFRGNGTAGSALDRVRQRKKEIAAKKKALKANPGADDSPAIGSVVDPSDYEGLQ